MFGESSKGCKVLRLCGCLQRTSCLRYKSSTWKFEDLENSGRPINVQLPTSLCPKVACVVGPLKCSNQASKPNHTSGEKWLAKDAQGPNHIGEKWSRKAGMFRGVQAFPKCFAKHLPKVPILLACPPKVAKGAGGSAGASDESADSVVVETTRSAHSPANTDWQSA